MSSDIAAGISGFAADALRSLTSSQIAFLQGLPKAELHAHLNGSIPIYVLQDLAREYSSYSGNTTLPDIVKSGLQQLQDGVELNEINEFFGLFPAIYALTSTPSSLARATRAVLHEFLAGDHPQCTYLELRTTPRKTDAMSREKYIETVLEEVEKYPADKAALIVSLDRRMTDEVANECVALAVEAKSRGRRVVGVDLCGDPVVGDMREFAKHFSLAKANGLGVTLHIAETTQNTPQETLELLSWKPDRLGHATFLDDDAKNEVLKNEICVEICLSSNLLCKTVTSLDDHHIRYHLRNNHPIAICTDDVLPFRNSLLGEYALLMAKRPLGLGLSSDEIERVAKMGMECRFR